MISMNDDYPDSDTEVDPWKQQTISPEDLVNLTESEKRMLDEVNEDGKRCLVYNWKYNQIHGVHCGALYDGFECWSATPANQTVYRPCPIYASGISADAIGYRVCKANGLWRDGNWTNYSSCAGDVFDLTSPHHKPTPHPDALFTALWLCDTYFFVSIVSCVLLVITLFIFCYFRALQCPRICIHKNLVVSFIIRYLLIIIHFEPFISGSVENSYRSIDWLCKSLVVLLNYSAVANMAWMFVEGLYLHSRVAVSVFKKTMPFKLYCSIGWGLPIPIAVGWSVSMIRFNPNNCWNGWTDFDYAWIILAPIIAFLLINLILLINIIRIVLTKLRTNGNTVELNKIRKAVRAAALLFPLLGLTNILYAFNSNNSFAHMFAYRLTNAILQSSQGIFVAIIHCFLNTEVRSAIRCRWSQFVVSRDVRMSQRRSSTARSSIFISTNNMACRRETVKLTPTTPPPPPTSSSYSWKRVSENRSGFDRSLPPSVK